VGRRPVAGLEICARLRVPEVWRWDGQRLRVFLLRPDGQYAESAGSLAFPFLPVAELERFLSLAATMSETQLIRAFRDWARDQIARGLPSRPRHLPPRTHHRPQARTAATTP